MQPSRTRIAPRPPRLSPHAQEEYRNALERLNAPQPAGVPAYSGRARSADTKRREEIEALMREDGGRGYRNNAAVQREFAEIQESQTAPPPPAAVVGSPEQQDWYRDRLRCRLAETVRSPSRWPRCRRPATPPALPNGAGAADYDRRRRRSKGTMSARTLKRGRAFRGNAVEEATVADVQLAHSWVVHE
jgi:hypothetical protein